jgi:hypothetical protein
MLKAKAEASYTPFSLPSFATLDIRSLRHEYYIAVLCCARYRGGFCGIDSVCHQQQGRWVRIALMQDFGTVALVGRAD